MVVVKNRFKELLAIKSRELGRKISIVDVAETTRLNRGTLEAWARNDLRRFDSDVIVRICEYLDCSIGDLLIFSEIGDTNDQANDIS